MLIERIYVSSVEQLNAINAAKDPVVKRDDMASVYADCIRADTAAFITLSERVDFVQVNNAILQRWPKGLEYIKRKAWKLLEPMV